MFARWLCIFLVLILSVTALGEEAISAADALFGDDAYVEIEEDAEVDGTGTDEDMYGANDTASASNYRTLSLGDSDGADAVAYVVFLQNRLIELGYLEDQADGTYGDATQTAVRNFQRSNNLDATGIADAATQARLYSDTAVRYTLTVDDSIFTSDTVKVQNMLVQLGFMINKVDGQMGDNTRAAIRSFKEYMVSIDPTFGATPTPMPTATPYVDTATVFGDMPVAMDQLQEGVAIALGINGEIDEDILAYANGQRPFLLYRQTVRNGDSGNEVMRVQKRLKYLKYVYAADGAFGNVTELALKYFQRKNGLPETGVADEQTQLKLFSADPLPAEEYVFPYKIVVDISDQRVYIGSWNGSAYHDLVKKMKCSTGKSGTPTPTGTYQAEGKAAGEWYYFKEYGCYAKWATRIVGGILFHSITFNGNKKPSGSTRSLGRRASHGCIRLTIEDAKWIYDNCPAGTTVVIRD